MVYKNTKEDLRMIKKADRFISIARHTLDTFNKLDQLDPSVCQLINNGLIDRYKERKEEEIYELRKKYGLKPGTPVILFAGRLDPVKGVNFLIRAFRQTLLIYPDARLYIAGDGSFVRLMEEACDCWTQISFTGRIDREKLYELYSIATIGVVCSLHEEFGLVAIEMMMHKLPVIVSDTGGLAEIVEDWVSGLKIPVETKDNQRLIDPAVLNSTINELISLPEMALQLGENGRKRFLANYEIAVFKEKMIELYTNL